MLNNNSVCGNCQYERGDHAAENDACPIKLTYLHGVLNNIFHTANKYTKQTGKKVIEQPVECPCGIFRVQCDYHK